MSQKQCFRNAQGCCICCTKSSSSRFVKSTDYEPWFGSVFGAKARTRSGFICNACVLSVKRGKKSPISGKVLYANVLDSRNGPGPKHLKQITKRNKRKEIREEAASKMSTVAKSSESGDSCSSAGQSNSSLTPPAEFRAPYPRPSRAFYKKRVILPPVKLPNAEEIGVLFENLREQYSETEKPLDCSQIHHAMISGKRRRIYGSETASICSTEPAESFISDGGSSSHQN